MLVFSKRIGPLDRSSNHVTLAGFQVAFEHVFDEDERTQLHSFLDAGTDKKPIHRVRRRESNDHADLHHEPIDRAVGM